MLCFFGDMALVTKSDFTHFEKVLSIFSGLCPSNDSGDTSHLQKNKKIDWYLLLELLEIKCSQQWDVAGFYKMEVYRQVESQMGIYVVEQCFIENQKGAIAVQSLWW